MKTFGRLLLAGLLGTVLVAAPVYTQDTRAQLNLLMTDTINLKNAVNELQKSSDQRNAEMKALLQDILARFSAIDASVQKLSDTVAGLKANDDKSARDLQQTHAAVEDIRKTVNEGMLGVQNQVKGLTTQIQGLKTTEQSLPGAADVFNRAFGDFNAGFFDLAIGDFREFLNGFPTDSRAGTAQFYIGDSLMALKKYDLAIPEFDIVLAKYPDSGKNCLALYRKGQALAELKQNPQAITVFQSVTKQCPDTQEAVNAAVDLKNLQRPARRQ